MARLTRLAIKTSTRSFSLIAWVERPRSAYDSLDQLSFVIDPLGRKTQYTWCDCGSISTLTDPNGNVTTWHHDLEGRQIAKVYQDSSTVNFAYESNNSRLHTKTDALGQVTVFSYNLDNTLQQRAYSNAVNPTSAESFTYDSHFNRLSTAANGWGTYTYSYNNYITNPMGTPITGGGRLSSITNNVISNSDITFTYDALGRTTNRSINSSTNSTTWSYDAMSRVTPKPILLAPLTMPTLTTNRVLRKVTPDWLRSAIQTGK